jgi:TolB-like protein
MRVLVYLSERQGQVAHSEDLMHDLWPGKIVTDATLYNCIKELRNVLDEGSDGRDAIQTVPKKGYRLRLPVSGIGAPESQGQMESSPKAAFGYTRRWIWLSFIGLVLVASAMLIVGRQFPGSDEAVSVTEAGPPVHSIAVLPFEDLSPAGDQEYFSDGISEEILNALAHISKLHVISRSSAFSYKGKGLDIPTIAEELGVTTVLEGSVRKSGRRIRIAAQLIDAKTDAHVWSETYDRDLEDVFAVQDEISAAIVAALKEHFGLQVEAASRTITTVNTEAHEAYLRGRHLVVQRGGQKVTGAVQEFEKAITLDPDYAVAHAELAIAILLLRRFLYGDLTASEAAARAAPHVERAMALDPTLAEAHAAAGNLSWVQENRQEALRHFSRAIQINPGYSVVYTWMGSVYQEIGDYKEGFAMTEVSVRLNPLSSPGTWNYLIGLINQGRLDEAALQVEKLVSMYPDGSVLFQSTLSSRGGNWADYIIGRLDAVWHDPRRAIQSLRLAWQFALIGLEHEALVMSEYMQPFVLQMLGRSGDAVKKFEASLAEAPESLSARRALGLALAGAGDYERARPILEEMWQRSGRRVSRGNSLGSFLGDAFSVYYAAALIAIRRDAGEGGEIGELMTAIRDNVRRYQEAGLGTDSLHFQQSIDYETGLADFLSGDRDQGLALIARAVEDGFFILPNEAYLQVLYNDPGFAPIRAMQVARQKRERNRFLAIVCNDNPYDAVWQPAGGTCEQFALASDN